MNKNRSDIISKINSRYNLFKKKTAELRKIKFDRLIEFRKLLDEEKLKKLRGLN
jgi:hypothetical protein